MKGQRMLMQCFRGMCVTVIIGCIILIPAGCTPASKITFPEKAKVMDVVNKLKGARIISIQDCDKFNAIDQEGMNGVWGNSPVNDYDRYYPCRLKEYLGLEIVIVRSPELLEEMAEIDNSQVEKVADTWISQATKVKNVTRNDILRPARLYLAQKALLKKYHAVAISYNDATLSLSDQIINAYHPLVMLEFSKEKTPSCNQAHLDCLVTQLIVAYLTDGRIGYVGDALNDWHFKPTGKRPENVVIIGHCTAPINPHGNDRIPYLIRDHIHSVVGDPYHVFSPAAKKRDWFSPDDTPTATTVEWPTNEPVTIVKFDVFRKKVSMFKGTALDGNALYQNFPEIICRNKTVIRIDDPQNKNCYLLPSDEKGGLFRNWWGTWGCHQVVFYGDQRKILRDFAALTGFEVVE